MSISFVPINTGTSKKNLDQLDPLYMYTEILKKILFTIEFEPKHFREFIEHCRLQFSNNDIKLNFIERLEKTYCDETPILWYTLDSFLYPMLNFGLRTMDGEIIIRMGFFINDLHRQIQELYSEQFGCDPTGETFTVYRGQCLPLSSFEEMKNTVGGLMSFNNFLSTSRNLDVSMRYAPNAPIERDSVSVLFVMTINPAQSTIPFASVNDVGYFGAEEDEILFSMHSVFRIVSIQSMGESPRLFQETFPEAKGWFRLGSLLLKIGQAKKAEEVFSVLLEGCEDECERGRIYHYIAQTKDQQGEYAEAIEFYEKAVEIERTIHPSNHLSWGSSYNNIGTVYEHIGDYPKALASHEKALAIYQQSLPPYHPDLAASYSNIGNAYDNRGDYSKALSCYEKALAIQHQSLPPNHPDLAVSYNNIGNTYYNMGDYPNALSSHEKALTIKQQSLSPNHPGLAASYNNIGYVHEKMDDYRKALSNYERAMAIGQQSLPSNHAHLQMCKKNLDNLEKKPRWKIKW